MLPAWPSQQTDCNSRQGSRRSHLPLTHRGTTPAAPRWDKRWADKRWADKQLEDTRAEDKHSVLSRVAEAGYWLGNQWLNLARHCRANHQTASRARRTPAGLRPEARATGRARLA